MPEHGYKVTWVVYEGLWNLSVFPSQVALPFLEIARTSPATLYVFERADRLILHGRDIRAVAANLAAHSGARVVVRPRLAGAAGIPSVALQLSKLLRDSHSRTPHVVHARGTKAGMAAARALKGSNCKLVVDARGLDPEEAEYAARSKTPRAANRLISAARMAETIALDRADSVLAVSSALADCLVARHGLDRQSVFVSPCSIPPEFAFDRTARASIRKAMGLSDQRVGIYVGTLAPGQMPDWVLLAFSIMARRWTPFTGLILCSPHQEVPVSVRDAVRDCPHLRLLSLSHDMVPGVLSAADVGLLMREASPVNQVASPVKIAEMLGTGLPIVATDAVEQVQLYLRTFGAGIAIPAAVLNQARDSNQGRIALEEALNAFEFLTESERVDLSRSFHKLASTQARIEVVRRAYNSALHR